MDRASFAVELALEAPMGHSAAASLVGRSLRRLRPGPAALLGPSALRSSRTTSKIASASAAAAPMHPACTRPTPTHAALLLTSGTPSSLGWSYGPVNQLRGRGRCSSSHSTWQVRGENLTTRCTAGSGEAEGSKSDRSNDSDDSSLDSSSNGGGSSSSSSGTSGERLDQVAAAGNEVTGGRSVEWMGDEKEVEVASRLIAQWKKEGASGAKATPDPAAPSRPPAPPQEVLLKAVSDLSKMEGRSARTTNVVMGGTAAEPYGDDWLELDKKVNTYPSFRGFTAIGTGGDDFVDSMVVAVESVLEMRVPKWQVSARESAGGRYVSVKIGPLRMESSDQVRAIYEAMRKDERMRYFL